MKDHTFNDDLLTNPGDLKNARTLFPEIFHVLDHHELRAEFLKFDRKANEARARTRFLGFTAICGAVIALLGSATEVLWGHSGSAMWVSVILESVAILATLAASGRLWLGPSKQAWLEARLMTERLRQWHFQVLVARLHDSALSCDKTKAGADEEFRTKRAVWFKSFRDEYKKGKLDALLVNFSEPNKSTGDWLHPTPGSPIADGALLTIIHEAYRTLRFKHQRMYANYMLRDSSNDSLFHFLRWPLLRQSRFLNTIISACMVIALLCSIVIIVWRVLSAQAEHTVVSGASAHGPSIGSLCAILILTCTIVSVALRTMQEGLGIDSDRERYREYRSEVENLESAFDRMKDAKARHDLMIEMEGVVVKEMRQFLHSHKSARFVL